MSKQASAQRVSMSLTSGESAAAALTHCPACSISSISSMDGLERAFSLFVVGIVFEVSDFNIIKRKSLIHLFL